MKEIDKHFCLEYVKNGNNGAQAYLSVHPKVKYGTAKVMAHKLLNNEEIKDYIEQEQYKITRDNREEIKKVTETIFNIAIAGAKDSDKIRAAELVYKLNGMLVDKQETILETKEPVKINIDIPRGNKTDEHD